MTTLAGDDSELRKGLIIAFKEEHNLLPTTRYIDDIMQLIAEHDKQQYAKGFKAGMKSMRREA